jgi:murein DD-endopeptidase MepM/ murein hydrolase activator NlpD
MGLIWMRMTKKHWSVVILLSLVLSLALGPVYGSERSERSELERMRQEQNRIQRAIEQNRQLIRQTDRQISSVSGQLRALEEDIEDTERDINYLQTRLRQAQARVAQTEKELGDAIAALEDRTKIFRQRLKEIYINGSVNYLEVLVQATSMTEFLVRFDLLRMIAEQDIVLLNTIEANRQNVEERKISLEARRDEIIDLKGRTERQLARQERQKEERERLISRLRTDKETIERALAELEADGARLADRIREIASRQGQYLGGVMAWPVPGHTRITSPYGWRVHPILRARRFHQGIDIAAPSGTRVIAAEVGQVILANWFGAYGKAIVIDHGGGVTTTYAHLSRIEVRDGQNVTRGQAIGRVGSTGASTGPHLHFEVRERGEHVNPWKYLR